MFTSVFQALKPTAETMVRWAQYSRNGGSTSNCSQIMFTTKTSLINQFFLFLCFLTAGLMEKDLSFRYHISPSTTSRIIRTWANYLYFVLGSLPIWPSREKIDHYMPDCFTDLYPKCSHNRLYRNQMPDTISKCAKLNVLFILQISHHF